MANTTDLLSGDQYMELLIQRQKAWMEAHPDAYNDRFPPLYVWFIKPGDEALVDMASLEHEPTVKREPQPRQYRSAESLRAERDKVQEQIDALWNAGPADRAAANLSPFSRSKAARRAGRRRFEALDREIERGAHLNRRLASLNSRIISAEAREAIDADAG
jgi:hypothetical protein